MDAYRKLQDLISSSLAENNGIWQMDLLSERKFIELANDKGLYIHWSDSDIRNLWQIGFLRADLIYSQWEIEMEGLIFIKFDEYRGYFYQDARDISIAETNLVGIFKDLPPLPDGLELFFHPFRFLSLYKIFDTFELKTHSLQILKYSKGLNRLVKSHTDSNSRIERTDKLQLSFNKISKRIDLAVSCEPITSPRVFGSRTVRIISEDNPNADDENYFNLYDEYNARLSEILTEIGVEEITTIHSNICTTLLPMRRNLEVYRILRFTNKHFRLNDIHGELGAMILILTMGEIIRRAAEKVFEIELREEDAATMNSGDTGAVKESRYGTARIIDNVPARREFLRKCGLDYTVRLRWYVEGYTEFAAFNELIGNHTNIEIINLKGNITAAGNKGLAFKENLQNDLRNSIYSWVTIDNDDLDKVRILEKAAEAKEMFGMYFKSKPDFEFDNFTTSELATVIWEWAQEVGEEIGGIKAAQKDKLFELTEKTVSGDSFFSKVKEAIPHQTKIKKGEEWGIRLARYANRHPNKSDTGKVRRLHNQVSSADHACFTNYQRSRRDGIVDIKTGNIIYPRK